MSRAIPCMLMRGGTSKAAYFLKEDLLPVSEQRDQMLLRIMGSPDARQIDGLGGAHPLTSKVAIVSASGPNTVDYLFLQVGVETPIVSDSQNCGNLLAGVGPFAVERGLVSAQGETTTVRVNLLNTGSTATVVVPTPDGRVTYDGDQEIAGVPGTAVRILIEFSDTAGSSCGALLPTGNPVDCIDGVPVTCVDNGMPTMAINAAALGLNGTEAPTDLESDDALRQRIESLRIKGGALMGLGDVRTMTTPKVCLVSPARDGGTMCTRTFIPHRVHEAIGVLCAASVGAAWQLPQSALSGIEGAGTLDPRLRMEHPTGFLDVEVELDPVSYDVRRTANVRTARKIFDGTVFA